MKISESQVRRKIRELILEQFDKGKPDTVDLRSGRPDPKMKRAKRRDIGHGKHTSTDLDMTKKHKHLQDFLNSSKKKISDEVVSRKDFGNNVKTKLPEMINKIKLVLIKQFPDDRSSTAQVLHIEFKPGRKSGEKPNISNDIKDAEIVIGKKHYDLWKKKPMINPIIVAPVLSDRETTQEDMNHEVDHVKNNFLTYLFHDLNRDAVLNAVRDDLVGKSKDDILSILTDDGFFKKSRMSIRDAEKYIGGKMITYYQEVHKDPPQQIALDELAVRINALKRSGKVDEILEKIKNKSLTYRASIKTYGNDVSQIVPLLKRDVSRKDLDRVVQIKKQKLKKSEIG